MAPDRQRIYHKRDRLKQLRAFYYAANLGNITRAAERLGLSQPAVSLHVRELEHELDAALFDRGGARITLTGAGETLYRLVSPLVEGVDDLLLNFAEQLRDTASGDVEIGASPGSTAFVLPPVLKRFRDAYPGIRVHIRRCIMREGLRLLLEDEVEIMTGPQEVISSKGVREKVTYRPLRSYELVLITPLDHPLAGRESVTREETAAWPAIVPNAGTYSTQSGESVMREAGLESNAVIEAGGWGTIKHYVEAGLGIAIIPSICLTAKDLLSVIPLRQYFEPRSYGFFLRADKRLSALAERFVNVMARYHSSSSSSHPHLPAAPASPGEKAPGRG